MKPSTTVAPFSSRLTNEKTLPKRTLLLIGLTADARCHDYGIVNESAGPITARLMSRVLPDAVVISLISHQTDAIEDLEVLSDLGFRGRCLVLAKTLPNRALVLKELRQHAAGLRITLLTVKA